MSGTRMMIRWAVMALCVAAATPGWAWVENGLRVSNLSAEQEAVRLVADNQGGTFIIWQDISAGNWDIYAKRLNKWGEPVWDSPFLAVCTAAGDQIEMQAVTDGGSGFYAVWTDKRSGQDIYLQHVYADGNVQYPVNGTPVCAMQPYQNSPKIAADGHNGAVIVWHDTRSLQAGDIFAQRIEVSGDFSWAENGIAACADPADQSAPDLAVLYDSDPDFTRVTVVWQDYRNGNWDIFAQRLTLAGVRQWDDDGRAVWELGGYHFNPRVVAGLDGSSIIAWQEFAGGLYNNRIGMDRLDRYGTSLGWNFLLTGQSPQIAANGYGGVFLAYTFIEPDGATKCLLQSIDASGTTWFTNELWSQTMWPVADSGVRVLNLEDAESAACYFTNDSEGVRISAQQLSSAGNPEWGEFGYIRVCDFPGNHEDPQLLRLDQESILVAWVDVREPEFGTKTIYAQRLSRDEGAWGYLPPHIREIRDQAGDSGGAVTIRIRASDKDISDPEGGPIVGYNVWRQSEATASGSHAVDQVLDRMSDANKATGLRIGADRAEQLGFPDGNWILLGYYAAIQQDEYVYLASTVSDSSAAGIPWETYVVSAHTSQPTVYYVSDPASGYSVDNSVENPVSDAIDDRVPRRNFLAQNRPNPFNPRTEIRFALDQAGLVSVDIFDVTGRRVRRLLHESRAATEHHITWDGRTDAGRAAPSGTYYYRFVADGFAQTRKMVLVR